MNPLIIALDVEAADEARALVRSLGESAPFYKVGMELYAAAGPELVRELVAEGKQVFVDLKFYDISETVKRATAQVAKMGATFLTVHASRAVMRAAVEGKSESGLKILGVTVLTSFDETDLKDLGYSCTPRELVDLLAGKGKEAGVDGLVCSPLEVARVRQIVGPEMKLVTPGVRSAGTAVGDQKRVATPAEAIANGADYLVVGREVTRAADPAGAVARILESLRQS